MKFKSELTTYNYNNYTEQNEGTKYDEGKERIDLIPPYVINELAKVFTIGSEKYGEYNWIKGIKYSRLFSACQRHLWKYWSGEDIDNETGMSHLSHALCNIAMMISMDNEWDDRVIKNDSK